MFVYCKQIIIMDNIFEKIKLEANVNDIEEFIKIYEN